MKRIDEIKGILAMHRDELSERFKVNEIGVFGSYVRGEEKEGSEKDLSKEQKGEDEHRKRSNSETEKYTGRNWR